VPSTGVHLPIAKIASVMKHMLILAGAAALGFTAPALGFTAPALAHPGNVHGNGHGGGYGYGVEGPVGYGVGGCPPGLAKKNPPCVPPGIARQQFAIGQRIPLGYNGLMPYNALPYDLRSQYGGLNPYDRYIYDNNYLYQVDPRTMVVQQVLSAILYGR